MNEQTAPLACELQRIINGDWHDDSPPSRQVQWFFDGLCRTYDDDEAPWGYAVLLTRLGCPFHWVDGELMLRREELSQ